MKPDENPQPPAEGSLGVPSGDASAPIVPGSAQPVEPSPAVPESLPTTSEPVVSQPATPSVMPAETPQPETAPVVSSYDSPAHVVSSVPSDAQVPPAEPSSIVVGSIDGSTGPSVMAQTPSIGAFKPPKRKLFSKSLAMILLVLIVLAGGSAAAYVGIIVPNKPQNVLKSAIANSLQQKQLSFNGNVQTSSSGSGGLAAKLTFTGQGSSAPEAADVQANLTISGVTFPVEVRLVDGNAYFKLGDVSSIVSVLNAVSPAAGQIATSLAAQLSNQWYVVDSTLIDESSEAKCAVSSNLVISKTDIQQLENLYTKNEFATIQSTSSAVINGTKVVKMNVAVSNSKVSNYVQGLSALSIVKQLEKCDNGSSSALSQVSKTNATGTTNISVWVNKSTKQIVQIGGSSSSKSSSGQDYTYLVGFKYGPVNITPPANAKPVADLISALESSFGVSSLQ